MAHLDLNAVLTRLATSMAGAAVAEVVREAALELLSRPGVAADGFDLAELLSYLRETGRAAQASAFEQMVQVMSAEEAAYRLTVRHEVTPRRPRRPEGAHATGYEDFDDLWLQVAHAFEGPSEGRRARYAPLARMAIREGDRVLDIGCGDGTFLDLVRECGGRGVGVDLDAAKVEECRGKGHEAHQVRAQSVSAVAPGEIDVVSMIHIVEHVSTQEALSILASVIPLLSASGRLLIVTPNIAHPVVQTNFWLDVTHVRPYPILLLNTFAATLGFPWFQSGEMAEGLEAWCYAFRDASHAYNG